MSDLSDAIDALSPARYYVVGTDSSGTMVDRGTDGTDGTWTDQPTFGQAALLPGSSASATFNGSSDRGTFTKSLGTGDWTVHVVTTPGGGTGGHPNRDFPWTTQFSGDRLASLWNTNTLMEAYAGPGSGGRQVNVAKDGDNHQWVVRYHLHASTGFLELWRDGVLVDSETGNIPWVFPSTQFVGTDYTGNAQHWQGGISDLALWPGVLLSQAEIEGLAEAAGVLTPPVPANARVTQLVRDTVTGDVAEARVTQLVRDVVLDGPADARITQLVRDVVVETDVLASARVTQLVRDVVVEHVPPAGQASLGRWS